MDHRMDLINDRRFVCSRPSKSELLGIPSFPRAFLRPPLYNPQDGHWDSLLSHVSLWTSFNISDLAEKLKELIPRQMFRVPIQACVGVKVREWNTVSCFPIILFGFYSTSLAFRSSYDDIGCKLQNCAPVWHCSASRYGGRRHRWIKYERGCLDDWFYMISHII